VFCDADTREALKLLNIDPDFEDTSGNLDYVHRRNETTDIYFVRNTSSHTVDTVAAFRVTGRQPELWNAIDGAIEPQSYYKVEGTSTRIPILLAPYSSVFVVFERPAGVHVTQVMKAGKETESVGVTACGNIPCALDHAASGDHEMRLSDGSRLKATQLAGSIANLPPDKWTISFQENRGAPQGPQKVPGFASWTQWPDAGVKYFSGTATYRTDFDTGFAPGDRVLLNLTDLHEICTVRINGVFAGTIWAMPYLLDITGSLKQGKNSLELEVTNLWPNRIIGDAQPSNPHPYTHTNIRKFTSESPLLPSGLVGPVTIETTHAIRIQPVN
jgi:hypothetical protein